MYLYGASGHAKVIIDILRANHEPIEALFDDNEEIHCLFDYPVLRPSKVCGPLIISIGNNGIRNTGASVDHECLIADYVHISPHCTLCGNVQVGEGTWIGAGSVVIPGVKIGKWSIIGAGSVVTKDIPDGVLAVGNRCKIIKNIVL